MNGYAILGWGSLLWDLDDLSPHVRGPWRVCAGPALPMEFITLQLIQRGSQTVIEEA